jgi:hypothetical protein
MMCVVFVFQKLREKGLEKTADISPVPNIELVSNPSSFAVYASIRHAVLKSLMQQVNSSLQQAAEGSVDSDSDEDNGLKSSTDSIIRLPKVCTNSRIQLIHHSNVVSGYFFTCVLQTLWA